MGLRAVLIGLSLTCVYVNHVRKYHMFVSVDDLTTTQAGHMRGWYTCPQVACAGVVFSQTIVLSNW